MKTKGKQHAKNEIEMVRSLCRPVLILGFRANAHTEHYCISSACTNIVASLLISDFIFHRVLLLLLRFVGCKSQMKTQHSFVMIPGLGMVGVVCVCVFIFMSWLISFASLCANKYAHNFIKIKSLVKHRKTAKQYEDFWPKQQLLNIMNGSSEKYAKIWNMETKKRAETRNGWGLRERARTRTSCMKYKRIHTKHRYFVSFSLL